MFSNEKVILKITLAKRVKKANDKILKKQIILRAFIITKISSTTVRLNRINKVTKLKSATNVRLNRIIIMKTKFIFTMNNILTIIITKII